MDNLDQLNSYEICKNGLSTRDSLSFYDADFKYQDPDIEPEIITTEVENVIHTPPNEILANSVPFDNHRRIVVSVYRHEEIKDIYRTTHTTTVYVISIAALCENDLNNTVSWEISKRYSDFEVLYSTLCQQLPGFIEACSEHDYVFPSKNSILNANQLKELRLRNFNQLLDILVQWQTLPPEVDTFLEYSDHIIKDLQLLCKCNHKMVQISHVISSGHLYPTVICDECSTSGLEFKSHYYHCDKCSYDVCSDCLHLLLLQSDIGHHTLHVPTTDSLVSDASDMSTAYNPEDSSQFLGLQAIRALQLSREEMSGYVLKLSYLSKKWKSRYIRVNSGNLTISPSEESFRKGIIHSKISLLNGSVHASKMNPLILLIFVWNNSSFSGNRSRSHTIDVIDTTNNTNNTNTNTTNTTTNEASIRSKSNELITNNTNNSNNNTSTTSTTSRNSYTGLPSHNHSNSASTVEYSGTTSAPRYIVIKCSDQNNVKQWYTMLKHQCETIATRMKNY